MVMWVLEALSGLDEAGKDAEEFAGESGGTGKKQSVFLFDQNDDRWRNSGEFEPAALTAFLGPHVVSGLQFPAALAAE